MSQYGARVFYPAAPSKVFVGALMFAAAGSVVAWLTREFGGWGWLVGLKYLTLALTGLVVMFYRERVIVQGAPGRVTVQRWLFLLPLYMRTYQMDQVSDLCWVKQTTWRYRSFWWAWLTEQERLSEQETGLYELVLTVAGDDWVLVCVRNPRADLGLPPAGRQPTAKLEATVGCALPPLD